MLRERVAALVAEASDGELTAAQVLAADCSLTALGLTSLGYIRLIDAIEEDFGLDLEIDVGLDTLDGLVEHLSRGTGRSS
jgi:acyl carrier protein